MHCIIFSLSLFHSYLLPLPPHPPPTEIKGVKKATNRSLALPYIYILYIYLFSKTKQQQQQQQQQARVTREHLREISVPNSRARAFPICIYIPTRRRRGYLSGYGGECRNRIRSFAYDHCFVEAARDKATTARKRDARRR